MVWSGENRFSCIVKAETALAHSLGVCGIISKADADAIVGKAGFASHKRAREIEAENNHEMTAIIQAISEVCGSAGRFVHLGATSNDILDTALGLQIKEALDILDGKLRRLLSVLLQSRFFEESGSQQRFSQELLHSLQGKICTLHIGLWIPPALRHQLIRDLSTSSSQPERGFHPFQETTLYQQHR